ncbi:SDR family NAD(P)-dependent oxidoreductase [Microbacterium sp. ProA8]|jgi:NAD(P)-dependent dehydrogenase (short-subunit alcohol dehydrogenase family)|uniref:SDR family NAD(P)-dependent oxidoreductase n=1 Tax=Microbacterium chionoecetis TaxID=3153754 RepID=UPI003267CA13
MPTALVTGTRRGIGRAVARRLAGSGWTVFAGVRDLADWKDVTEADERITAVRLDVTDPAQIDALADVLPDRLDALVNNAAAAALGPIEALTTADLRRQFEVNVVGTVAVTRAVLPRLRTAAGRIVFVSSVGSRSVVPMEGAYCASKCAVEGIADALRVELRPWNIAVCVVEPGPTDTETWREVDTMIDDMEARMSPHHRKLYAQHVVGLRKNIARFGSSAAAPDAVVRAVEHALTARRPRARYVVGAPARTMVAMHALLPTRTGDAIGARIAGLT